MTDPSRAQPARKYRVFYAVTRGEYYEIEASNAEEAEDRAFEDGEMTEMGDTTNVIGCGVEEIAP